MDAHEVIQVFGEAVEIVVPSTLSNYTVCVGIQTSPAGGGPPPHRHMREEEVFIVLEGSYEFFDGETWSPMKSGEVRCSLRGKYHGFRNVGDTVGRLLFVTNGGGLDEYFKEISPLRVPIDMERLNEISHFYNYEFAAVQPRTGPAVLAANTDLYALV